MNLQTLALVALATTVMLSGCENEADKLAHEQDVLIATAKLVAAEQLRDPSSAQFTNVSIGPDGRTVCGEINGKNGFGGYAGSTRFTYSSISRATLESVINDERQASIAKMQLCVFDHDYRVCKGETLPYEDKMACFSATYAPQ